MVRPTAKVDLSKEITFIGDNMHDMFCAAGMHVFVYECASL